MLALVRNLRRAGILGLNRRNAEYVLPYNERRFYPLVDDKLQTKRLAIANGIAVPELYGVIEYFGEVAKLDAILQPHQQFVIKPARGSGGNGIVVITGRIRHMFRNASGASSSLSELEFHVQNTLGGVYSLGGQPDKVLIEYCVQFDPLFENIAYQGVPDIRVVVFRGVPVMAMVRLPTRMSGGRANLHQGAIGVGVDMSSGRTLTAVLRNEIVTEHPDTLGAVSGVVIPHWDQILEIAARCYELTNLGYQGVDIVLDKNMGPMLLELNARPGLNIQIANRAGLEPRLQQVQDMDTRSMSVAARAAYAMRHFGVDG